MNSQAGWLWLSILGAVVIGVAYTALLMPLDAITGDGAMWRNASGDNSQSLSLHLAFQNDAWRLPPLFAQSVFWPRGVAVSMGDVNPLMSLLAKVIVSVTGGRAINLMGVWFAACFALMPLACVYAVRQLAGCQLGARGVLACWVAGALAVSTPALLYRLGHINLCGHFLIVLAIGLSARLMRRPDTQGWVWAFLLLLLAVLTHPYIFMLCAAMLCVPALQDAIAARKLNRALLIQTALAIVMPVVLLTAASGTLGGGEKGFGFYSMNLLSMIVPQHSGLFGAELPTLDGTGGQYEGFAYLGAGVLLLVAAWLLTRPWRGWADWRGMVILCAALFVFAINSKIYAGHVLLLNLGLKPWEDIFAVFRTNGRAIWPVVYLLMLAGVVSAARRPAMIGVPLLFVAAALQWFDAAPPRAYATSYFAGEIAHPPIPALPAGGTLISTAPAPGCNGDPLGREVNAPLLLAGARAGMKLGDVGMGRTPKWFNCERFLSDGLEAPMRQGELRAFTDPQYLPQLRLGVFGGAVCAKTDGFVLCGSGTGPIAGEPVALRGPESVASMGRTAVSGTDLARYLGFGWKQDAQHVVWSEGPRMSLLLRPEAQGDQVLTVNLMGVAFSAGGTRDVVVAVNGVELPSQSLPDMQATTLRIRIPQAALNHGIAWVAFNVIRPVDPARRSLSAPVSRAALRLDSLVLAPATALSLD
jgi:hypothetical protein